MSVRSHRGSGRGHRLRFAEAAPPGVNYSVVTGRLTEDPCLGRNQVGEPVTLLRIEFPVAGVECPQVLLTWASCDVEASDSLAERHAIRSLEAGATILAAGQLSERWEVSGRRSRRRAAIVAALVHPEPPPDLDEPLVLRGADRRFGVKLGDSGGFKMPPSFGCHGKRRGVRHRLEVTCRREPVACPDPPCHRFPIRCRRTRSAARR